MDSYIALSYWDLAAASVLVFINAGLSVIFRLRVHRSLLIATIRMVVQLALVGLVLTTLFSVVSPLWTGLAALGMVLFAGHEAAQRQERGLSGWWSYGLGTGSMMVSSVLVTCAGRTGLVGEYGRRALWRVDSGTCLRQRPGLCRADEGVADCTAVDRGATAARTRPCADDATKGAAARRADRSPRRRFRGGGRVADQSAHADGSRCVVGYA